LRTILALAAALCLAACAIPRPGVQGLDNASAEMAIKSRMLRSDSEFSGIDVTVVEGVALLTGHVPDQTTRDEAGRIARSAPNIRDVGNELLVDPDGRRLLGANDQLVLSQVRARLLADRDIRSDRIHIEVYDGVVYLLGPTRGATEAEAAARHASLTPGVKRVVSFLSERTPAIGAPGTTTPYDPYAGAGRAAIPQGDYRPPRQGDIEEGLLGAPAG
jgi:osmotically-inducible protein OsmY